MNARISVVSAATMAAALLSAPLALAAAPAHADAATFASMSLPVLHEHLRMADVREQHCPRG